jgi:type IV secretory pathway VirB9-like protein
MSTVSRFVLPALGGLVLLAGCTTLETYPPAIPAHTTRVGWGELPPVSCYAATPPAPLPELASVRTISLHPPSREEWKLWRVQAPAKQVCRGKGKRRTCKDVTPDVIDEANRGALVRPAPVNTALGQSAQVRYEVDLKYNRVYEVPLSPVEFTMLSFPEGERLASDLMVDKERWEVLPGKYGQEETRREVFAIRPLYAPMTGRGVVMLRSGGQILLKLVAQERPGAISVTWDLPAAAIPPPKPTPDQIPPHFDTAVAYEGYTMQVEGKYQPAWMPQGVLDDGKNTLIKFPGLLEGIRVPVVSGIQPDGKPALVQSRLYVRPEHGAWMYIQGLWPALQLKDAAGTGVKLVRQPPKPEGSDHAY